MGFLTQGLPADPALAAAQGLQYGRVGTELAAAGQVFGGIGQGQQLLYGAGVAGANAKIALANADAARQAGAYAESASKLRYGQLIGEQKAGQAASGFDVAGQSAQGVRAGTQMVGDMDAAMIHYNAARQAYGEEVQAMSLKAQAQADRLGAVGAITGGLARGAGSLLGGAAGLSEKWAQFKALQSPGGSVTVPGYDDLESLARGGA